MQTLQRTQVQEREDTVDIEAVTITQSEKWTAGKVREALLLRKTENNRPRPGWEEVSPEK